MTGPGHAARADFFEPVLGVRIWWRGSEGLFAPRRRPIGRDVAPDVIEPVIGWRVWRVIERRGRLLLASLFVNVAWPSRSPLEARCHQFLFRAQHSAPESECTCGIYATPLEDLPVTSLGRRLFPTVLGRLALWGDVVECEHGWRAQRAYPQHLYVPSIGRGPSDRDRRLVDGLAHYGVPVEPICTATREDVIGFIRSG